MKRKLPLLLAVIFLFVLAGCSPASTEKSGLCKIVITEGEGFKCTSPVARVKRGENAEFILAVDNGYEIGGVSYKNHTLSQAVPTENGSNVTLTVNNVRYTQTVEITTRPAEKQYTVTVNPDPAFTCAENQFKVAEGQNAVFNLDFNENYTFGGFDGDVLYDETGADSLAENGVRKVTVTVKNIETSLNLNVKAVAAGETTSDSQNYIRIRYHANGGAINGSPALSYSVGYKPLNRRRPNTETGAAISREGYVLVGWNVKADGSGEHIGLGSRYNATAGATARLYAEWRKCADGANFNFSLINRADVPLLYAEEGQKRTLAELSAACDSDDKSAVITAYSGNNAELVIPDKLAGYPVAGIESGAFEVCRGMQTVVFPQSLEYLADLAFKYCNDLREIYISDNIEFFGENALGYTSNVKTLHVNAVLPPAYANTENGQLANKIELLETNPLVKPKLVFFAGCSTWYGINASQVSAAYNGKYDVYNMGVIGGVCSLYQIDLIAPYLTYGDAFVHNPELGAVHQLMVLNDFDSRVYTTLESNYDYLARLDLTRYGSVWKSFSKYISGKKIYISGEDYVQGSYAEGLDYMGDNGDYLKYRNGGFDNEGIAYDFVSTADITGYNAIEKLNACYAELSAAGIKVFFGYGSINADGLDYQRGVELITRLSVGLNENFVTLYMSLDDAILGSAYCYDQNYHLSTDGAAEYTRRVIEKLKKTLK